MGAGESYTFCRITLCLLVMSSAVEIPMAPQSAPLGLLLHHHLHLQPSCAVVVLQGVAVSLLLSPHYHSCFRQDDHLTLEDPLPPLGLRRKVAVVAAVAVAYVLLHHFAAVVVVLAAALPVDVVAALAVVAVVAEAANLVDAVVAAAVVASVDRFVAVVEPHVVAVVVVVRSFCT